MTEQFAADWLALREPFDHATCSVALARRLADLLPRRPRLMDLGAGTGSLFRFLAPIIGRGQDWVLVDADGTLLDEAFGRTAAWARRQGYAATAPGDELLVSTPHGLWRMRAVVRELTAPSLVQASWPALCRPSTSSLRTGGEDVDGRAKPGHDEIDEGGVDAIVCSALLDLVSAAWLTELCDTLTVPLLACLTVDGRDAWRPRHRYDALVLTAFRRDQRRDKGFGPALGITASRALKVTASAASDWRVPRVALGMQRALIDGTADAARAGRPAFADAVTAWQEARLRQALRGRLAITIGHRDILVLPPGG